MTCSISPAMVSKTVPTHFDPDEVLPLLGRMTALAATTTEFFMQNPLTDGGIRDQETMARLHHLLGSLQDTLATTSIAVAQVFGAFVRERR